MVLIFNNILLFGCVHFDDLLCTRVNHTLLNHHLREYFSKHRTSKSKIIGEHVLLIIPVEIHGRLIATSGTFGGS